MRICCGNSYSLMQIRAHPYQNLSTERFTRFLSFSLTTFKITFNSFYKIALKFIQSLSFI